MERYMERYMEHYTRDATRNVTWNVTPQYTYGRHSSHEARSLDGYVRTFSGRPLGLGHQHSVKHLRVLGEYCVERIAALGWGNQTT